MTSPLETAFLQSKLPRSRKRLLVVRLLAEAKDHPTVDQLHERARLVDPRISKSAVFCALSALAKVGLATVLETRLGMFRYEDATHGSHGHLIDQDTGVMVNFRDDALDEAIDKVARELGFRCLAYDLFLTAKRLDD
jgi:Fur family ferric uptake transcriptional regulator